ncbi:2-succinyl-6-hydroxy-2,4-cyclohexadiene-1-carboxy late synthase [Deinococcus rubellus]|uniref:alpha/beta fold hydrolase n=1 Tax=Deinococcus rubellus TaxID=1889240 RepID=UPI0031F10267
MKHSDPFTAPWTSGICRADAVNIHYLRTGRDKPPLIALHGLNGSGACWTPLARRLEDEYDVVMPDARGHGASSAPLTGYSYRDHAKDVLNLTKALELTAPVLLGHSMGGMTAALVASQLGFALRGVIVVDPTFISPEWQREVYESDVVEQHKELLNSDKSALVTQLRLRHPHRSSEMIELLADARLQTRINAFGVLTPPNPEYRELIHSIPVPLLLILGSRGIVSLETADELQGLNPRLRYELVPDAGHGLPFDQPERLGTVVESFLQSLITAEHAVQQ